MVRPFAHLCLLFAVAQLNAQLLTTQVLSTTAHPFGVMFSSDGQYVFCGVRPAGSGHASVDVYHRRGNSFEHWATQVLPSSNVEGIVLIPGTDLVAFGLAEVGIGVAPLAEVQRGNAKIALTPVESGGVAGLLTMSSDGSRVFVGDEYGEGGTVRAFAVKRTDRGSVEFEQVGKTQTPRANAGIAISPDGKHVFATGEILESGIPPELPGHGVPTLEHGDCTQERNGRTNPNGALYTIDAGNEAIVSRINAGCSPTRVIVSLDGRFVYMTARGDNRVLVFDANALVKDPQHAFVRSLDTGGASPVGLALFDGDSKLMVANSNRFGAESGNVTILDLKGPDAKVLQTIKTGLFPRNIASSPDGKVLAVSVAGSDQLMILHLQ